MAIRDKKLLKKIATRIKQLRKKRGITQEELAIRIGVKQHHICRWEKLDRVLNVEDFVAISRVLGEPLDYFVN